MRIVFFAHSFLSDWNHGNAHFLRGVGVELQSRGHDVGLYEPADAWSVQNLVTDHGEEALTAARRVYPTLDSVRYDLESLDLDEALDGADIVIVHEWNAHALVRRVGEHHRHRDYVLLFHDTHHRSVTEPHAMAAYDLSHYDGVLAFGEIIRERYVRGGWAARAWTWHEAADVRLFHPKTGHQADGDVVWVGNWGDEERTAEVREFLIEPVRRIGARAAVHGVRYPADAVALLNDAGIAFRGYLPNFRVPDVFARHRVTVHVPRRPYVETLHGIPTIRPFEALACGIPLVCSPWDDAEGLFRPGEDFLVARSGAEMARHLRDVLHDDELASHMVAHGLETIRRRHTCAHRVDELLAIVQSVQRDHQPLYEPSGASGAFTT